jgi:NAD(P)-dependent dehydrogenase (short-subunit alcohol dehydrogenase family)
MRCTVPLPHGSGRAAPLSLLGDATVSARACAASWHEPGNHCSVIKEDHFGTLDVVINNAGYGHFGMIEELTEDEVRSQLETKLFGALWVTQAALPIMRAQAPVTHSSFRTSSERPGPSPDALNSREASALRVGPVVAEARRAAQPR